MHEDSERSLSTDQIPATDLSSDTEVAVKLKHHGIEPSLLHDEFEIYKSLADGEGMPKVY